MKRSMVFMAGLPALVLAGLLAGCTTNLDYRMESDQKYYQGAAAETTSHVVSRQRVYHWVDDPRTRKLVAFFEKHEMRLKGMREYRDVYYILNAGATRKLGFVNENGMFFRYRSDGTAEQVGGYPVMDTGLKVFLGYPLSDRLALEEVDPYRVYND